MPIDMPESEFPQGLTPEEVAEVHEIAREVEQLKKEVEK